MVSKNFKCSFGWRLACFALIAIFVISISMVLKVFAVDEGEGSLEQKNTEYKNALAKYIESLCAASGDKDCKTTYEKEIEPCVKEARTKIREKESRGEKAAADGSDERDFFADCYSGKTKLSKEDILRVFTGKE
ncbi:MAG: hypothetical protein ACFNZO_01665, partial [Candidatus Saccharibacteria bacterium]